MISKIKPKNDLKDFSITSDLNGHIFAFGKIGSGKSVCLKTIIERLHDNRHCKVFDTYGSIRNEGYYWAIPSQDKLYWDKFRRFGQFDEEPPKQYKVNFLYPYFQTKIPKKLPKKMINGKYVIKSIPFTIPIKDITREDLEMVVGVLTETNKYLWQEITHAVKKTDNGASLEYFARKFKGVSATLYKNFILPLSRENFLMDSACDLNLDIIQEAKDIETITVLCLDKCPKEFHLLIMNYFLRKLTDLINANRIPKKNLSFIREAATFFRATDESIVEDRFKIFKKRLSDYIRMGRSGLYFCLDCQSAQETKSLVQGSEDFLLLFKTTAFRDKEEACEPLRKERRMRNDQITDLSMLNPGQCYVIESGKVAHKVQILLPRTMYWKKQYGDFLKSTWVEYGGEFEDISEKVDYIKQRVLSCKKKFEELKEQEQNKKKKFEKDLNKQNINQNTNQNINQAIIKSPEINQIDAQIEDKVEQEEQEEEWILPGMNK